MGVKKPFNTTLDKELMYKLKMLALKKEVKINELLEEGIKLVLEKSKYEEE